MKLRTLLFELNAKQFYDKHKEVFLANKEVKLDSDFPLPFDLKTRQQTLHFLRPKAWTHTAIEYSEIKDIPIDKLIFTQKWLKFKKGFKRNEEPIGVIKLDGKYYIYDGHHRVFLDMLDNKRTIKANLLDYDKFPWEKQADGKWKYLGKE